MMWTFIKASTGVKFTHEGEPRAIWLSIVKTAEERRAAGKVSLIVRGLVKHLNELGKLEHDIAKKHIDADCQKGIIVFKELAPVINVDAETDILDRVPAPGSYTHLTLPTIVSV